MQKRVIIASDGVTVDNVVVALDDETGPLVLPRSFPVAPGMLWNGSLDAPVFTFAPEPEPEPDEDPEPEADPEA